MRICFISNPNSTHTRRWVGWFARHGHEVQLLADVPVQEPWADVPVTDLSKLTYAPMVRFFIWAIWLRRFLRQWRPDILHAHRVNSAGWVAAVSGFHPLVVTPWGSDLYQLPQQSRLIRWMARYVLQRADLVTADAQDLLKTAMLNGANPERLRLVQWGVDLEHYYPAPADTDLRDELGLGAGPVILSPRGVNRIYNLDVIIQSVAQIRPAFTGMSLVLRDYNTDPRYKHELNELIKSLELEETVHWVGRIEPWERVADIYRLADVVVSVPTSDSTPVSILEALACGIPVITTDLPALREWVTPEESCLMVPQREPKALASAISQILTNRELAERLRIAGPAIVKSRANHQVEMVKMEGLYRELISK